VSRIKRIAITTGEPAGIGPQIALHAAAQLPDGVEAVLIGDAGLLPQAPVPIEHVALNAAVTPGQLDVRNAPYVLRLLDRAIAGAVSGEFDAIVTAPVHKGVINEAGIAFSGHTEYLAQKTNTPHVVMLLTGAGLRVALVTTHVPLAQVPAAITPDVLALTFDVLHADLVHRFGIEVPRIAVCGLNPHAGEGGHLGREEIDTIIPSIAAARHRGVHVEGPLPADTLFVPALAQRFDVIVAMYHDQGLAPFKRASFGQGVNVTLGLPFVRTSVDHGTALDLAGRARADAGSLVQAVQLAATLVRPKKQ